jgi:predicted negative regulator of RcsB-dependent stress response
MGYKQIFNAFYAAKNLDSVGKVILEVEPLDLFSTTELASMSRKLADAYSDSTQIGQRNEWLAKTIALDKNDIGGEAQIELAMQLSQGGKYKESNEMITTKFKNEFADVSDGVIGKAYVLLAENFLSLKNLAQARAILKSIIDNSTDNAIVEVAKLKLKSLPLK